MDRFKLLVIDVDGTLTDGKIMYAGDNLEAKEFCVKDGLILKVLPVLGVDVLLLTGRTSEAVKRRANELGCRLIDGVTDKNEVLSYYLTSIGLSWNHTAYIGDDLNDYRTMKRCAYAACPSDAVSEIRAICHYVSPFGGGIGAVRDICEQLLKQENSWEEFLHYWRD